MSKNKTKQINGIVPFLGVKHSYILSATADGSIGNIDGYSIISIVVTDLVSKERVIHFESSWKRWPRPKYVQLWKIIASAFKVVNASEIEIENEQ